MHLLLVDLPNLAMRAYHARGRDADLMVPTVVRMLEGAVRSGDASHVLLAADCEGESWRKQEFAEYKAGRDYGDDLRPYQLVAILEPQLAALGYVTARVDTFEADDLIATGAAHIHGLGGAVDIASWDQDLYQVVRGDAVCILREWSPQRVTIAEADVLALIGAGPSAVPDHKALVGDKSDNLPRVAVRADNGKNYGISKKMAFSLLQRFGSLDGIYEHIGELEPKIGEWLRVCEDQARMVKRLATLSTTVDLTHVSIASAEVRNLRRASSAQHSFF